jgi:hypothetical protein
MKRRINEALGVPENIIQSAIKLFDNFIEYLSSLDEIDSQDKYETELVGDYRISDMKLNRINLNFNLHKKKNEIFKLILMGQSGENYINSKFEVVAKINGDKTNLRIDLLTPNTFENDELIDFFVNNKRMFIPILAHELKHSYDEFKKNKSKLSSRVDYTIFSQTNFGNLTPLNDFLFNSYYIHNIENLVRPTELAADIKLEKVTPKQFYDYFTKNKIFQNLKNIKNFSFEKLKKDLKNYESEIDDIMDMINEDYNTIEEKIDRLLELFYFNITNWKNDKMIELIYPVAMDDPLFPFFKTDKKDNFLNDYLKKTSKYENDYESFFLKEEKYQQQTAFKMIKKLGRLYELTQENIMEENKSIWDREKYQKYFGKNYPITTTIKSKDELISELVKRINNKK